MESSKRKLYFFTALACMAVVFYLSLSFPFAIVHELLGHALVARSFGKSIVSWSFSSVFYVNGSDTVADTTIKLAGGMVQALVALPFFWAIVITNRKMGSQQSVQKELLKRMVFFSLEVAFLTIAFNGVITGIWEGLFYASYVQVHANLLLWRAIDFTGGILFSYVLYKNKRSSFGVLIGQVLSS